MAFLPAGLMAAFGGFVRLVSRQKPISFGRALAATATAVFVGLIVAIFARHYGMDWALTIALSGLAGVSGKTLLALMTEAMERVVGKFADKFADDGKGDDDTS